ncbi:hypothetical protein [Microbispora sp. NPDC049633]|uniref:hypothetical protein n=1 Tax=Microbispora sp. NPDC049633 TaxID=3154355 RepID=UPI003448FCCB
MSEGNGQKVEIRLPGKIVDWLYEQGISTHDPSYSEPENEWRAKLGKAEPQKRGRATSYVFEVSIMAARELRDELYERARFEALTDSALRSIAPKLIEMAADRVYHVLDKLNKPEEH